MSDDFSFLNNELDHQSNKKFYVRFKYKDILKWATLYSDNYEIIKNSACSSFPEIIGIDFQFQDIEGAIIGPEFISEFLSFSNKGVVISIITQQPSDLLYLPTTSGDVRSDTPFSTFSPAYITHGINSCSTETVPSLPPSPASECTNFDDDDVSLVGTPCRKRLKTAVSPYVQITNFELKNYLLSHPGGKEIINYYKENRTLDDPNRKKLVNIIVDHMLQGMPPNLLPCNETKIQYAKAVVHLFPRLKDPHTRDGYEAFFDPSSKRGFITTRLRNLFRVKQRTTSITENTNETDEDVDNDLIAEKIKFLKNASKEQEEEIIKVTKETFEYRNKNRDHIITEYPRFLDTDGLINLEFSLMYPSKQDLFLQQFPEYIRKIKEVYKTTSTHPNQALLSSSPDSDEWNSTTNALIILVHLLPCTTSKTTKKTGAARAVEKLIAFQDTQIPLNTILKNKPSTQPFILAVGNCKNDISKYYIIFDDNIISCPKNDILNAFDTCFKIHFVFNLHFNPTLDHFYKFVQYQFYDISLEKMTTRIRELHTKLENTD